MVTADENIFGNLPKEACEEWFIRSCIGQKVIAGHRAMTGVRFEWENHTKWAEKRGAKVTRGWPLISRQPQPGCAALMAAKILTSLNGRLSRFVASSRWLCRSAYGSQTFQARTTLFREAYPRSSRGKYENNTANTLISPCNGDVWRETAEECKIPRFERMRTCEGNRWDGRASIPPPSYLILKIASRLY